MCEAHSEIEAPDSKKNARFAVQLSRNIVSNPRHSASICSIPLDSVLLNSVEFGAVHLHCGACIGKVNS